MLRYFSLLMLCAVYTVSQDMEIDADEASVCREIPCLAPLCGFNTRNCPNVTPGQTGQKGAFKLEIILFFMKWLAVLKLLETKKEQNKTPITLQLREFLSHKISK